MTHKMISNPQINNLSNPFESHAAAYDDWFDSERGSQIFSIELDALKKVVDTENRHWLEVGVGSGRFAVALGVESGVDPSSEMVRLSSERGVNTYQASGEQLPFGDSWFDGVILVCTICFIDDPDSVIKECRRVLKDDGQLVIGFVPANSIWGIYHSLRGKRGHAFYFSAHFYTSEDLRALVCSTGFTCRNEYGCVLPSPNEISVSDVKSEQSIRNESFMVLSFFKTNNKGVKL